MEAGACEQVTVTWEAPNALVATLLAAITPRQSEVPGIWQWHWQCQWLTDFIASLRIFCCQHWSWPGPLHLMSSCRRRFSSRLDLQFGLDRDDDLRIFASSNGVIASALAAATTEYGLLLLLATPLKDFLGSA